MIRSLALLALATNSVAATARAPKIPATARVAAGDPAAIAAAVRALRDADAGDAEELHDALARAIQVTPERILPLVDTSPALQARDICVPFLSDDEPKSTARAALLRSYARLSKVRNEGLVKAKAKCIREIRSSLAALYR